MKPEELLRSLLKKVADENDRVARLLHLTANENTLSPAARAAIKTELADRYYNWSPDDPIEVGNFMLRGMPGISALQEAAERIGREMLGAAYIDTRPLSGMNAMLLSAVIATQPGDLVMSVPPEIGGHFLTSGMLAHIGRRQCLFAALEDGSIDVETSVATIRREGVRACLLDRSYILSRHPVAELRGAVSPSVVIVYDASQVLGLIMGGMFENPLTEGADILTANTHKTFPGPHKGLIATASQAWGERAKDVIDSSFISTQHTDHTIALYITLIEVSMFGRAYACQVVANARALAAALTELGFTLRRGGKEYTDTHQVHVVSPDGSGREWYRKISRVGISTNRDVLFGGLDVLRLGVQDVTRRGMRQRDMIEVAGLLHSAISESDVDGTANAVEALTMRFREARYCIDVAQSASSTGD